MRRALQIAGMGDGDGDLLVGDQVFQLDLGGFVDDLGAALVADTALCTSSSSFTITPRSFLSVARIDSYSAIFSRISSSSFRISSVESWVRR